MNNKFGTLLGQYVNHWRDQNSCFHFTNQNYSTTATIGYDTATTGTTTVPDTYYFQTQAVPAASCNVGIRRDDFGASSRLRAEVSLSDYMLAQANVPRGALEAEVKRGVIASVQRALVGQIDRQAFEAAAPTYKPPPREFNPFLNASDQLEDFIRYVGGLGVKKNEVLGLPIDLFIKWLILKAAEKDEEPAPEGVVVVIKQPRCLGCQRWMPKTAEARRVPFCAPSCLEMYSRRTSALQVAV